MPELPEVETIRRQLEKEVKGRTVRAVDVFFAGRLNMPAKKFAAAIAGARISSLRRRAKLLVIDFSNGTSLAVHLKMTGRFLLITAGEKYGVRRGGGEKHVHVVFRLSGGKDLAFEDARKFGYLKLMATAELDNTLMGDKRYGPEPLEKSFTAARLAECLRGPGPRQLKAKLLSQECVAGVGNIYADEGCWRAGVLPTRKISTLSDAEATALYQGIVGALRDSIRRRGTSADRYLDLYGRKGTNVAALAVYGREGKPCPRCATPIKKIRFAGRGTHFCPSCQK